MAIPLRLEIVEYYGDEVIDRTWHMHFQCPSNKCLYEWHGTDAYFDGSSDDFMDDPLIITCDYCESKFIVVGYDDLTFQIALIKEK